MEDEAATQLELYKLAVEMADRTSARRAGANSFFVTLNATLAAAIGLLGSARRAPSHGTLPTFDAFGLAVAAIGGIALASTWWLLLRYYRRLNRAKFVVILEMEQSLPSKPYTREWEVLHSGEAQALVDDVKSSRRAWWRRSRHREATVVEQVVPLVFAAIYAVLIVRVIWFR